jgi:hypothetical protein
MYYTSGRVAPAQSREGQVCSLYNIMGSHDPVLIKVFHDSWASKNLGVFIKFVPISPPFNPDSCAAPQLNRIWKCKYYSGRGRFVDIATAITNSLVAERSIK